MSEHPTLFKLNRVETQAGPLALVTMDNGEDYTKPTVFGRGAFESALTVVEKLESGEWAAMVLTGKPHVFSAGADITEFPKIRTRDEAIAGSHVGHELFARIRALPFPTVAAINGAALGGGVEIALHCSARTISTAVRHFALPEVFLGIFPAWGGTQLVPRLVPLDTAIQFVVSNPLRQNRMLTGAKAFELGFADRLLEPVEFVDESIAYAIELVESPLVREPVVNEDVEKSLRKGRAAADDAVHGAAPAPYVALDLLALAVSGASVEDGYRAEEEAIADLMLNPSTRRSLYAFDLIERRAKKGVGIPDVQPRKIEKIGIVGAGLMATQLATLFLKRFGVPLMIRDLEQETVDLAVASIREELGDRWCPIVGTTNGGDFAGCDLVLEAVFEELGVKKQVFAELEQIVDADCILATNTSSLSITEMAADLEHPERVVGLHFFNPVAILPLIEVVRAEQTDDTTLATAWDVTKKLRKRGVLVRDAPAFVVNRVLTRMTTVLMDSLEHGNTVEETDDAVLRLGMPMAPSVLLAMVGPRVANHVLETLHDAYPDRFPLSPTLANYANGSTEIVVAEERRRTSEQITRDVLEAVADEIRHLLDEGVVAEAADVDTCLILGAGWPFFLGGITPYLRDEGLLDPAPAPV
ncbi:MAG: 3-hydroxyacyl-CoA dehydrogenase NAD-binding domain-containing protein [Gaiellaceae bacterium]